MRSRSLIFSALLAAAACKSEPKPTVVRIGQDLDRTGSLATPSWGDSIRVAANTMNQALKQAGHGNVRFEIAEGNSGNAPDQARATAIDLVKKQGAKAVITDSSQDDIAVNMLAYESDPSHDLGVPVVCMACTSPQIDDPAAIDANPVKQAALRNEKGWNFRTTLSDSYQSRVVARVLLGRGKHGDVNGDGKFKLGIYASDDPYGHGFSNALKGVVEAERPGAIVEQLFHDVKAQPGQYDFSHDVKKLADSRNGLADAVVEISFPKFLVWFMKAWQADGSKVALLHTHNFRSARLIEQLGVTLEGEQGTSQAVLGDGPSAATFTEDLVAATAHPPAFRDAAAYDAAMTLMLATLQAARSAKLEDPNGVSGAQVRDAMRKINDAHGVAVTAGVTGIAEGVKLLYAGKAIDYRGASGPCDFDAHGDVVTRLARFHVQGGKFVDQEKYDCSAGLDCPPLVPHAER
jgi:ABC-type branched-subunit amino acid transport system substrate-binding protein